MSINSGITVNGLLVALIVMTASAAVAGEMGKKGMGMTDKMTTQESEKMMPMQKGNMSGEMKPTTGTETAMESKEMKMDTQSTMEKEEMGDVNKMEPTAAGHSGDMEMKAKEMMHDKGMKKANDMSSDMKDKM